MGSAEFLDRMWRRRGVSPPHSHHTHRRRAGPQLPGFASGSDRSALGQLDEPRSLSPSRFLTASGTNPGEFFFNL